jgi:signal transduction histidine kinase/response regulator RpfG family c-di-GMP phosphodiesterase
VKNLNKGPSPNEIKLKAELDRLRVQLTKLKKAGAGGPPIPPPEKTPTRVAPKPAFVDPPEAAVEPDANGATEAVIEDGASDAAVPAAPETQYPGSAPPVEPADLASADEPAATNGAEHAGAAEADGANDDPSELETLRLQVLELNGAKQRLSKLYFNQLEENRKRAQKLHQVLENICDINAVLDLDALLERFAETIRKSLGFRIALIRLREPGTETLEARAFAGISAADQAAVAEQHIRVPDFLSWLKDEFKVSRSYFISHNHEFNRTLPKGYTPDLGPREDWEWHASDILLVPLFNRTGELVAAISVDDPVDRLVPSREVVELLEIFGNHAVVAIENARLYRQLEGYARELEAAGQHMREMHTLKSNFLSIVSHELRTPLTAIRAYVDTLMGSQEGDIPHERFRHFLGIINDESQRLARLIESVLDLNRFDSGAIRTARQCVDLWELIQETTGLLEAVAQVGQVVLKVENECADTRVDANRDQMRQLALHLGSNAVKFTPAGGTVTIRLLGNAREVTLQVEDTGIGIPEQSLEKIFERFYQVDSSLVRRYGGTGLGLAICKSIVDWHGGAIRAESAPGRGSRFTVTLPRHTAPRVVVRPGPRTQAASEDVLKLAIEMVADVMNARVASMLCAEPNGDLVIRAAMGLDEEVVQQTRIKPGEGVAGWVAVHRRPVCVSGAEDVVEVTGSGRPLYRSRTFLSVPIESQKGLLGILNVTDPVSQKPFEAEDCHLLLHLAERVSTAWEQALTMEHSQNEVEGTTDALRQVLRHLERARRAAPDRVRLSCAVARELKLSESEAGVISFAASIHDVGMRKIGEHVVEKGGVLDAEERAAIERHPEVGAELLRPLERVGVVRDVVLSHHEWWDGTGYPRGLKGKQIPIGGRILAVVDAFESMTVGRPHKPAVSRYEALNELYRLKGRQFDPDVVDAFERALVLVERQSEAEETPVTDAAQSEARR